MTTRSGIGFDVHPLVEGRPLILGGVSIPFDRGLSGHSDGDVLTHGIIDALLGGAGLGDIGTHFPSSDSRFEGVAGSVLLRDTLQLLHASGWRATYVDATILAELPVMKPFVDSIAQNISASLGISRRLVNVKAKTTDGLGFIGKGEGIGALAVATLEPAE